MIFLRIFDWHVLFVAGLTLAATYVCMALGIRADLPTSLIAVAIVFPIVFSINAAYTRREEALRYLGLVRATIGAVYLAHRDWVEDGTAHARRADRLGRELYRAVCTAVAAPEKQRAEARRRVAEAVSDLSRSVEDLRRAGLAATEVSRVNNYLNLAMTDFERLRAISDYRTPSALRAYSKVYLNLFPMLYAPLYANVGAEAGAAFGYAVALAFAFVLVGLDNIQDALENPFDGFGTDDIELGDEGELYWMTAAALDPDAPGR